MRKFPTPGYNLVERTVSVVTKSARDASKLKLVEKMTGPEALVWFADWTDENRKLATTKGRPSI